MRRRLLFLTLVVAITAVALFGIPLAFVISQVELTSVKSQVKQEALDVAHNLQTLVTQDEPADLQQAAEAVKGLPRTFVSISRDGGRPFLFGTRPPASATIAGSAQTSDFIVSVEVNQSVAARQTKALALISVLALPAIGVAVGLAVLQTRRLTRPLSDLASAADRLGLGDARPFTKRYGIPELDRVAEGLDGSARRISELLAAERDFAADASHQLRTPLTALSMRLEEMLAAADRPEVVAEEGAAALVQAERLAAVVGNLLGRTRRSARATPEPLIIDEVVSQQVVEWEPAFRRVDRRLQVAGRRGLIAYATPGMLSQVVSTLLDNALAHGAGTVTIRTSETPKSVVVEVRDEGEGVPSEIAPRIFERSVSGRPGGTGLGLALARSIAAADGGNVVLVRPRPAVFAVFVPRGLSVADHGSPPVSSPA